jgi:ketosteroid isomerase-like protein
MNIEPNTITKIIDQLKNCQFKDFVDNNFDPEFSWEIKGTSVLSGSYSCKDTFMKEVIGKISSKIKGQWTMNIHNHYNTKNVLIIEMTGSAITLDNNNYNNQYCWIMHFRENKIIHLTAYYDSLLVNKTLG